MLKRLIGLAVGLGLLGPAHAQPVIPLTQASTPISISAAGTTQLVAGQPGKAILVTSALLIASGATSVQFIFGTGASCSVGQGAVTGNLNLAAQGGFTQGSGVAVIWVVPQGAALCVVNSAAVGVAGVIAFAQL